MQEQLKTNTPEQEVKNLNQELTQARKEALKQNTIEQGDFKWLNENSRKFLGAGYLVEGVTAEQRIREIADRAEQILQIPGYADKFYNYMSHGFY